MTLSPAKEAALVAAVVTLLATLASMLPPSWVASAVGAVFLGAAWLLVLRRDDATVEHHGVSFAGLVEPGPIQPARVFRELGVALGWAGLCALVFFPPFYFGFRFWTAHVWHARGAFPLQASLRGLGDEALGQVAVIALPEEVFYRGYLQTRLDDAWPGRVRILGAPVGLSIPVTSAVFALGHFATIHDPGRLAVFFPSLVFGWLRARTGGVGAGIGFHAACNVFSAALFQMYGPR